MDTSDKNPAKLKFNLLVKGSDERDALDAAHERGIENLTVKHVETKSNWVALIGEADWNTVFAWFHDDLLNRAPFPIGSLLHYSSLPKTAPAQTARGGVQVAG